MPRTRADHIATVYRKPEIDYVKPKTGGELPLSGVPDHESDSGEKKSFPLQPLDLIIIFVTAVLLLSALQAKLKQVVSFPSCQSLKVKTRVQK
jgi:hypothetical protein